VAESELCSRLYVGGSLIDIVLIAVVVIAAFFGLALVFHWADSQDGNNSPWPNGGAKTDKS